jgi:hypothetical protein
MVTGVHGTCVHGGVFVASHRLPPAPEQPGWQFSTREVALELYQAPPQRSRNTVVIASAYPFPLSLTEFTRAGRTEPIGGRQPSGNEQLELFFRANHNNYWAIAWISAHASSADRSALASIVTSIKPR